MIKAVIFDIDDTLYDYETTHTTAMNEVYLWEQRVLGFERPQFQQAYDNARMGIKKRLGNTASAHNRLLYFQRTLEILGMNPASHALDLYDVYWNCMLSSMHLADGAKATLDYLRECRVSIAVCTDLTAHIQHRKIQALGLSEYISCLVTSEEAGVEKPEPSVFHLCLEKLECGPDECFFVGDNFLRDVIGATAVGLTCYWYNPHGLREPNESSGLRRNRDFVEISSFEDLLTSIRLYFQLHTGNQA